VQPLIQMLNNSDAALREMAAFALGRLAQNPDNQVGICHADGLRPLLDLLDSNAGNLQHNAAFALYGLADNEDNVPDIIKEGTVQRLKDGELIVQASKASSPLQLEPGCCTCFLGLSALETEI